jgi:hypothetical protein
MKVLVFTAEDSQEIRDARDLGASLEQDGYTVEYHDAEDEGTPNLQELYDIYSYPSFVVAQDDGSFVERWRGKVPLGSDIRMFLNV